VDVVTEIEAARSQAFVKLSHNSTGQAVAVVITQAD
jgi:hypothetical protein